ncbi:MAG: 30S ribosomal protein S3 [Planctomycetota bacterium]|jgi:small subunit ribosomal protein S3
MGQKVSPIGFRTGITLGWQSTWFAPKADYGNFLVEDQKIRRYVDRRFNRSMPKGAVAKIEVIRTRNEVKVTLHSARPGVVIGPRGGEVDRLREELEEMTGRKVTVNVIEIKEPDLNATLVAEAIAEQLSKRASFRRTMKQYCELAMNAGAKGVKIICAGRLAGSEMARRETQKLGSIPLHTLDANVDYAIATSKTTYGTIGVKAWIYKGKFGEEIEQSRPTRRRRPPRRISTGQRGKGRAKTASVQDSQIAAKADVVASPAEPDSDGSNNTKAGVKNGNDAEKS